MTTQYELIPTSSRKSFYGKAIVKVENNIETLFSYNVPIMSKNPDSTFVSHREQWDSKTTGNHINSFSKLNKKAFIALEYKPYF